MLTHAAGTWDLHGRFFGIIDDDDDEDGEVVPLLLLVLLFVSRAVASDGDVGDGNEKGRPVACTASISLMLKNVRQRKKTRN